MSNPSCCECGKEIEGESSKCISCGADMCDICSDMCDICLGYLCDNCKATHSNTHS